MSSWRDGRRGLFAVLNPGAKCCRGGRGQGQGNQGGRYTPNGNRPRRGDGCSSWASADPIGYNVSRRAPEAYMARMSAEGCRAFRAANVLI